MVFAANNRVKEIRQELNQEKIRNQSMEKSYKEKIDYQVCQWIQELCCTTLKQNIFWKKIPHCIALSVSGIADYSADGE